jgi:Zn-dependent protease with chaperone function
VWERAELHAMGVLRRTRSGFRLGPWYAGSTDLANEVLAAALNHAVGQQVLIDVPAVNPGAVAVATRHGFAERGARVRMSLGELPDVPHAEIYGITSHELG